MGDGDVMRTALHADHVEAGAAMTRVDGWEMPASFKGVTSEVRAVRRRGGNLLHSPR